MGVKFKAGDKVIPKERTLREWPTRLTKGKIYIVKKRDSDFFWTYTYVNDDLEKSFWSSPEKYFTKVGIYLGGE